MPVDAASVAAVDAARRSSAPRSTARGAAGAGARIGLAGDVRPLADGYTFAAIPATVERLLLGGRHGGLPLAALGDAPARVERVVLVLLDAFGWRFLERHAAGHPLLRRFLDEGTVAKLTTQFPSATPAHVTTLHTGRPVVDHGLYEWNLYEPTLDALVTPLMFSFAGDAERDTLAEARAEPRSLYPTQTLYRRLTDEGVRCIAFEPASFAPSTYDGVALDGADLRPYETLADAFAGLADALRAEAAPVYAYVYIDTLDAVGHRHGPSSVAFDAEATRCLDAIDWALRRLPGGTLVLLTGDHGQIDVDPARTRFVNHLWPGIRAHLRHDRRGRPLAPAGSARDLFLHTAPGEHEHVVAVLRELLGDGAEVHATEDLIAEGLFTASPGPRLRERLGDVCVLPAPGATVWWRERGRFNMRFRGHHGGLTPEEAHTHVASLVVA
jgi:Type I phosphodiesterase / nucleotide pyrophosphatase